MSRSRFLAATLAAFAAAVGVAFSSAAGGPAFSLGGEPVEIRADRVDVDLEAGTAVLEGHVELKRKDLSVTCPRVEATFDREGKIRRAKATGGVVMRLLEKNVRGEAEEAELDLARSTADLRGSVKVSQGGSTLTAQKAVVNLQTSRVSLEAVRGTLAAPQAPAAPSASAP